MQKVNSVYNFYKMTLLYLSIVKNLKINAAYV